MVLVSETFLFLFLFFFSWIRLSGWHAPPMNGVAPWISPAGVFCLNPLEAACLVGLFLSMYIFGRFILISVSNSRDSIG